VNREKDAFLIWLHHDRDAPENVRYLFSVQGRHYDVDLRQDIYAWASGESYTYSLLSIADDGQPATDDVIRLLKDALTVFAGFYGTAKVASVKFKF